MSNQFLQSKSYLKKKKCTTTIKIWPAVFLLYFQLYIPTAWMTIQQDTYIYIYSMQASITDQTYQSSGSQLGLCFEVIFKISCWKVNQILTKRHKETASSCKMTAERHKLTAKKFKLRKQGCKGLKRDEKWPQRDAKLPQTKLLQATWPFNTTGSRIL